MSTPAKICYRQSVCSGYPIAVLLSFLLAISRIKGLTNSYAATVAERDTKKNDDKRAEISSFCVCNHCLLKTDNIMA